MGEVEGKSSYVLRLAEGKWGSEGNDLGCPWLKRKTLLLCVEFIREILLCVTQSSTA